MKNLSEKGFRANRFKGKGDPVEEKDKEKEGEADVKIGLNHII